jgi:hypothetical protein
MMYTPRTALMMAEGSTALFYEFHACEHAISPNVSVHKFGKPPRLRSWTYPGTPASISVISEGAFSSTAISCPRISTRNPVRKPATSLPLRRYTTQSNYAAGLHALRITLETIQGSVQRHFYKQRTIYTSRSNARHCATYMYQKPRTHKRLPCCAFREISRVTLDRLRRDFDICPCNCALNTISA